MKKYIQGIGGMFYKAKDPKALHDWYDKYLGISPLPHSPWGEGDDAALFEWRDKDNPDQMCYSVFSFMDEKSDYMEPSPKPFMMNFRVTDLDALLAELKAEGIERVGEIQEFPFGRFAKVLDPEGNPIEFWQPAEGF